MLGELQGWGKMVNLIDITEENWKGEKYAEDE